MMSGLTSLSVFLELVVREVERENCEKFVRIPHFSYSNSLELKFEFRVVEVGRESIIFARYIRAKSDFSSTDQNDVSSSFCFGF